MFDAVDELEELTGRDADPPQIVADRSVLVPSKSNVLKQPRIVVSGTRVAYRSRKAYSSIPSVTAAGSSRAPIV